MPSAKPDAFARVHPAVCLAPGLFVALSSGRRDEAAGLIGRVLEAAEEGERALRDVLSADRAEALFKSLAKDIVRTP